MSGWGDRSECSPFLFNVSLAMWSPESPLSIRSKNGFENWWVAALAWTEGDVTGMIHQFNQVRIASGAVTGTLLDVTRRARSSDANATLKFIMLEEIDWLADWILGFASGETGKGVLQGRISIGGGIMFPDLAGRPLKAELRNPTFDYFLHLVGRSIFGPPGLLRQASLLSILNATQYEILFRLYTNESAVGPLAAELRTNWKQTVSSTYGVATAPIGSYSIFSSDLIHSLLGAISHLTHEYRRWFLSSIAEQWWNAFLHHETVFLRPLATIEEYAHFSEDFVTMTQKQDSSQEEAGASPWMQPDSLQIVSKMVHNQESIEFLPIDGLRSITTKAHSWFMSYFDSPAVEHELIRGIESVSTFTELGALQWGNSMPPRPGYLKQTRKVCHDYEHEIACQMNLEGKTEGTFGKLGIPYFSKPLTNLNVVRLWHAIIEPNATDRTYSDAFLMPRIAWLSQGGFNMYVFLENLYKEFWFPNSPRSIMKVSSPGMSALSLSFPKIVQYAKDTDPYCIDKSVVFGRLSCTHIADFTQYLNDMFWKYEWEVLNTPFDDEGRRVGMTVLGGSARGLFVSTSAESLLRKGFMDSLIPRLASRLDAASFNADNMNNNTEERFGSLLALQEASYATEDLDARIFFSPSVHDWSKSAAFRSYTFDQSRYFQRVASPGSGPILIVPSTKDEFLAAPGESTTGGDGSVIIDSDFQDQVVAADNAVYDIGTNGYVRHPTFSGWVKPLVSSFSDDDTSYFIEDHIQHKQNENMSLSSTNQSRGTQGTLRRIQSLSAKMEWEQEYQLRKENSWDTIVSPHGFRTENHGMHTTGNEADGKRDTGTQNIRRLEALNGKFVSRAFSGNERLVVNVIQGGSSLHFAPTFDVKLLHSSSFDRWHTTNELRHSLRKGHVLWMDEAQRTMNLSPKESEEGVVYYPAVKPPTHAHVLEEKHMYSPATVVNVDTSLPTLQATRYFLQEHPFRDNRFPEDAVSDAPLCMYSVAPLWNGCKIFLGFPWYETCNDTVLGITRDEVKGERVTFEGARKSRNGMLSHWDAEHILGHVMTSFTTFTHYIRLESQPLVHQYITKSLIPFKTLEKDYVRQFGDRNKLAIALNNQANMLHYWDVRGIHCGIAAIFASGMLAFTLQRKLRKERQQVWTKAMERYKCDGFLELQVQRQIEAESKVLNLWKLYIKEIASTKDLIIKFSGDDVKVEHVQAKTLAEANTEVTFLTKALEEATFPRIISHFRVELEEYMLYNVQLSSNSSNKKSTEGVTRNPHQLNHAATAGKRRQARRQAQDHIAALAETSHRSFWNIRSFFLSITQLIISKWNHQKQRMTNASEDRRRQKEKYKQWKIQIERRAIDEANKVVPASDVQEKMNSRETKERVGIEHAKAEAAKQFSMKKEANKIENEKKLERVESATNGTPQDSESTGTASYELRAAKKKRKGEKHAKIKPDF
jgi:hypothetical protein